MAWGEFKDTVAERRLFQRRALVMLVLVVLLLGFAGADVPVTDRRA